VLARRLPDLRWKGWSSRVAWLAGMTGPVLVIVSRAGRRWP